MNWNGTISLLIACLEFLLLLNLLIIAEKNRLNKIAITMVALLASYQFMEFLMCQVELQNSFFPYFAFGIITFLPPLNLLLTLSLKLEPEHKPASGGGHQRRLNLISIVIFFPSIFFILYYTTSISQFAVTSCTVLYATYHFPLGDLYGFFYYLPILTSIVLLIKLVRTETDKKKKIIGKVLLVGACFISLPVVIGFLLMISGNFSIISAIESIMCKFAFVYALCLGFICFYNSLFRDERNYFRFLFSNK